MNHSRMDVGVTSLQPSNNIRYVEYCPMGSECGSARAARVDAFYYLGGLDEVLMLCLTNSGVLNCQQHVKF